jgi:hypothetical protein
MLGNRDVEQTPLEKLGYKRHSMTALDNLVPMLLVPMLLVLMLLGMLMLNASPRPASRKAAASRGIPPVQSGTGY